MFPSNGAPGPMRCMIGSWLQDDWEITTTDRDPDPMMWAWRRPHSVWSSYPRLSSEELLTEHLQRRRWMIDTLGVAVATELSVEAYYAHERKAQADRKTVLQTKTMAAIEAEMHSFEKSPRFEWLGDLPRIAAECSVQ